MGAVAVERDTTLTHVGHETERSRLERLVLRVMRWSMEHPRGPYPRAVLSVSLVADRLGLGRFDNDMTVTTTGRKSGLPRPVVVSAILAGDRLYTMNPFGERAHWYRNLLADPVVTLQRRGRTWTAQAARLTDHGEARALYDRVSGDDDLGLRWLLRAHGFPETAEGFSDNIGSLHLVRFDRVDEPGPPPLPSDLVWIWPVAILAGAMSGFAGRSIRRGIGVTVIATVTLLATALGWGASSSRIEAHGTHPEGRWARLFASVGPRLTWWLYDAFDEALDLQPDDDVLDVACGCGSFLRTHATQAHRVAGIDHSESLIQIARDQNKERIDSGTAEFVVGDVTKLPWDEGTFSVVTANDVGCYEKKAEPAIGEMYRVLRSGGRAVLADDRRDLMEAAGFVTVEVEPMLRFGHITRGVKP